MILHDIIMIHLQNTQPHGFILGKYAGKRHLDDMKDIQNSSTRNKIPAVFCSSSLRDFMNRKCLEVSTHY